MLSLLTAAALSLAPHSLETHHDYRLTHDIAPHVSQQEKGCRPSHGMTVCANRADEQRRWRISNDRLTPQDTAHGQNVNAMRQPQLRSANPVEDGIRSVRPTALANFIIGD
ncbi:hypothetical protein NVSP9465_03814 [Novosphingobium sp. CECT 9465]|nr:hypothetical protein NVSP9465_03814 [Novosphingobium sp. CECT 9465]